MEFPFNVNNLFADEVSKVDNRLIPARSCPGSNEYKIQLNQVIDQMGEASAKAQSLHGPITSGSKLAYTDHILYVMKDSRGNNGIGSAVGILKIGTKRLFVYDSHGVQHELEPMCVLDFYVHESRQRMGCGRKLFEFMLKDQNMKAAHLAIDRPSHKFSQFLQKHYHLKATISQVNNFVVFNGFFQDRNMGGSSRRNLGRPPLHPYRRQNTVPANNHWSSTTNHHTHIESMSEEKMKIEVEVEGSEKKEVLKNVPAVGRQNNVSPSGGADRHLGDNNLSASRAMYSRHAINPTPPLPDIGRITTNTDLHTRKVPSPPALQRDGAPTDYHKLLNTHQDIMDRRGHLKVSPISPNFVDRHSAPTSHEQLNQYSDSKMVKNGQLNESDSRLQQEHAMSSINAVGKTNFDINEKNSDILLPKNFTPYSHLSLPPGDPYGYRESTTKLNNTGWNVFGVPSEPKSYSAKDRWRNTRPW